MPSIDPRRRAATARRFSPARAGLGGVLMGLANLVPGISGGTMLVAAGVYEPFIAAVADVTRLRLRREAVELLAVIGGSAGVAILLLAGPVRDLVVGRRWVMYSLFIGLTLGGIPTLWRMVTRRGPRFWAGAAGGFAAMVALALLQRAGVAEAAGEGGQLGWLLVAGVAGAASMILPGISGGYVFLVLGQYVTILSAIDDARAGLAAGDVAALTGPAIGVILPVGIGMVIGVAVVSNAVRALLRSAPTATLGVLLGLLAGAVVGLWPFQHGVPPEPGQIVRGREVTEANRDRFDPEDWPLEYFRPAPAQVAGAAGAILGGGAITMLIAAGGARRRDDG